MTYPGHSLEDKTDMIAIWALVLEFIQKTKDMSGLGTFSGLALGSEALENVNLKGILLPTKGIGGQDLQRDMVL